MIGHKLGEFAHTRKEFVFRFVPVVSLPFRPLFSVWLTI